MTTKSKAAKPVLWTYTGEKPLIVNGRKVEPGAVLPEDAFGDVPVVREVPWVSVQSDWRKATAAEIKAHQGEGS